MDGPDCGTCGHLWSLHPGGTWIDACAECVAEEDDGERAYADMRSRATPDALQPLAGAVLRALVTRTIFRRHRVAIMDQGGSVVARLIPEEDTRAGAQELEAQVHGDLQTLSVQAFREKYLQRSG